MPELLLLTKNTTFIIGPVTQFLGMIMNGIYIFTNSLFGAQNLALCIILFTIVSHLLMTPLTIRQQKFSKLQAKMNPELQKIQSKYKNKKDNDSMLKQNEETKAIYEKYGVSPMGSCVQLLIQMPIILALYQVIQNIPAYVTGVRNVFMGGSDSLVSNILESPKAMEFLEDLATNSSSFRVAIPETGFTAEKVVDILYKFSPANWVEFSELFEGLSQSNVVTLVNDAADKIAHMSNFFGLNIADSPWNIMKDGMDSGNYLIIVGAALIPILAGLTQFISTKMMPQAETNTNSNKEPSTMESSMKSMNTIMPIMSAVFCMSFSAGIGIYWIAGSVVRTIQQLVLNRYFDKVDMDELVKKNMEKVNRKREKKGLPPQKIANVAKVDTRKIENPKAQKPKEVTAEQKAEKVKASTEYYNKDAKPGSLASKAGMVAKFNEKNKK